jgi:hypothetical protein
MLPACWRIRAVSIALAACVGLTLPVRAQGVSDEHQLKAAFVYRFAQFVEWPESAMAGRPAIEFCVWPPNPFGSVLADLLQGEKLQSRPVVLRVLTPTAPPATCHVLFLHGPSTRTVLDRVARQPTLTVGDSPRFVEQGGIIQLIRADNRLQFNISLEASERAGLRLSSRLLELAANLRRSGP